MTNTTSSKPLRVLIVDDCADTASSLATLLGMWGYEVRTAASGPAAIELAGSFWPDAVMLDIGMPGLDGWEVGRRLRRARPDGLVLIATTGYGMEEDRERSIAAGFDHHLLKPYNLSDLKDLLSTARHRLAPAGA